MVSRFALFIHTDETRSTLKLNLWVDPSAYRAILYIQDRRIRKKENKEEKNGKRNKLNHRKQTKETEKKNEVKQEIEGG